MLSYPLLAFALSFAACGAYLRLARRWQILAHPNHRSSHSDPTPSGGGLPLVLGLVVAALLVGTGAGALPPAYLGALAITAGLALVGVVDDVAGLPVRLRFALYLLACLLLLPVVYGWPASWPALLWVLSPLVVLGLLWLLNLYNFMDGIDGLAATQCVLAASTAAFLAAWQDNSGAYALLCLMLAAAHAGFLVWNWSPARMFMGDAGSIATGFLLGALVLIGVREGALPLACWLILLAAFITDATVTLGWRLARRQDLTQAHRSHAYQRLSRQFASHRTVVLLLIAVHAFWLAPLATFAVSFPAFAPALVILAYIPLLLGMAKAMRLG